MFALRCGELCWTLALNVCQVFFFSLDCCPEMVTVHDVADC